jgi:hypothetical protein
MTVNVVTCRNVFTSTTLEKGTALTQWLRRCATNQKVAGSRSHDLAPTREEALGSGSNRVACTQG